MYAMMLCDLVTGDSKESCAVADQLKSTVVCPYVHFEAF
jgi:hypothetical protein